MRVCRRFYFFGGNKFIFVNMQTKWTQEMRKFNMGIICMNNHCRHTLTADMRVSSTFLWNKKVAQAIEWMWPNRPRFGLDSATLCWHSFTQFCKIQIVWPQWIVGIQFGFCWTTTTLNLGEHLNLFSVCSVGEYIQLVYLDYKRHYIYDHHSRHAGPKIQNLSADR